MNMTSYSREKLIDCLANEYAYLCHDGIEDGEMTEEEYLSHIQGMSIEQLIEETWCDTPEELKEYVEHHEESTYRNNIYDEPTITNGN